MPRSKLNCNHTFLHQYQCRFVDMTNDMRLTIIFFMVWFLFNPTKATGFFFCRLILGVSPVPIRIIFVDVSNEQHKIVRIIMRCGFWKSSISKNTFYMESAHRHTGGVDGKIRTKRCLRMLHERPISAEQINRTINNHWRNQRKVFVLRP